MTRPRPNYDDALAALRQIEAENPANFPAVSQLMVHACDRAIAWNESADPYNARREEERKFLESAVPRMLTAVDNLSKLADEYERCFDLVVSPAVEATGITNEMIRACGDEMVGRQRGRFMRKLLLALQNHLTELNGETKIAVKGRRTWGGAHRHIHGPLNFSKNVDSTRMPDARLRGLEFELLYHLRCYTGDEKIRPIALGDLLPAFGRPHYAIAAEFTNAALRKRLVDNGEAFNRAIRCDAGMSVSWWGWGMPEFRTR